MRLRSLEIQGFKSFPDRIRLEFGDGITAVVGPNGSGKSNIADAVRWVLGEQSSRSLRGQKMEDVIFNGTQSRKAQGYAMVQLTIDNSDGALAAEAGDVTVSRRLYRSGDSEYRIGGAMVRLKDIHQLFMDTGLGRDGYSIIGQGKIAEIVSAKSRERREIFEEAAGIAKYRYRREEAEKKLDQAEENLVRLRDILGELADRVEPLRIQSEKARQFLTLSEEKKTLEVSLWLESLELLKKQLSEQQDRILISKNGYEQCEAETAAAEEQVGAVYAQMQELATLSESRRMEIRALEERQAAGASQQAVCENDMQHNRQMTERLTRQLASATSDSSAMQAKIAEKQQEIGQTRQNLSLLSGRIVAAEEKLEQQKLQKRKVEDELATVLARMQAHEQEAETIRLAQASSRTLLDESRARMDALAAGSSAFDDSIAGLQTALAECIGEQDRTQESCVSLNNALKGYEIKRESQSATVHRLTEQHDEMNAQVRQKLQRAVLLEDLEQAMEGFAGSVKYILGEAKKGALAGVYGVVSSLISVPDHCSLAIETALGGALQNILVEEDATARQAIRMLQNKKAGRATFLPRKTIKGRVLDDSKVRSMKGYVGIASELISTDEKFIGVVRQLLGRVCVVEDLEAGTAVAKAAGYSFRIVTLDGQVINPGGSYTGGSSVKSSGVLGRRNEIKQLREQAQQQQAQLDALLRTIREEKQVLAELEAEMHGVQAELKTAQEQSVRLGFSRETLQKELDQALQRQSAAKEELDSLRQRIAGIAGEETQSAQLLEALAETIRELELQRESARERLAGLEEGVLTTGERLSQLRMTELSTNKDLDALAAELEQMQYQSQHAAGEHERIQGEITQLQQQNVTLEEKIAALALEKQQIAEQIADHNRAITDLSARRQEYEAQATQLRAREREISARREEVSRELTRLEERSRSLQADYDAIITKLWDEYELTRSAARELAQPIPSKDKANRRLSELRTKIRELGTVNVAAVEEYQQVSERYEFLRKQVLDAEQSKKQLLEMIGELTGQMRGIFSDNFSKIAKEFSRVFVQLFGGGHAELSLTDEEDVLDAGIEIQVQPPGKVIRSLTLLSGGEQAFVAIAIYFAILHVRPAPFCLLDEIEAALDDVNVTRFAGYLRQMSNNTQFIVITHRRGTMEEADLLYGVTMQDEGVSKLLQLKVGEMEQSLAVTGG